MGRLARLFGAPPRATVIVNDERAHVVGSVSDSGVSITPDGALGISTVFACVRVLAEDVAKLPLNLYRRTGNNGKERAADHPLYGLLHDAPNGFQTSFEFREMLQGHLGLRGNAYAFINRYGGEVRELLPIHPDRVTPRLDNWTPTYEVRIPGRPKKVYRADQILHLRGLASDGLKGLSPVHVGREAIGTARAAEQHGARYFRNGAKPGLVVKHPDELSETGSENLRKSIEASVTGENLFRVLLLEEGMDVTAVGLNQRDAQYIESRKFQVPEIARFYRMPLHKIQDMSASTNNNIEHQGIEYLTDTLQPWLVRWEQRLTLALLTPKERKEFFFEFNADGVVRGDLKSRYEAHGMAIDKGWKTRNEVRIQENLNPADGLDEFLVPLNMGRSGRGDDESE